MAIFSTEYDVPGEHVYNAAYMEVASGQGRPKSLVDASEIFFHNYDTPGVLTAKRGAGTFVLGGGDNTGQVTGGVLALDDDNDSTAQISNLTQIVDDFGFRFKVIVNFASVTADKGVLRVQSNVDNSRIEVRFNDQGGGVTRVYIKILNAAGVSSVDQLLGSRTFAIGSTINIGFSRDLTGTYRMLLDGVIVASGATPTGDFSDCTITFGDLLGNKSNYSIDNDQFWSSDIFPSGFGGYAFPFPEPTSYTLTEQLMVTAIPLVGDSISNISIKSDAPSGTSIGHLILIDSVWYYHNGTSWVVSDQSLSQSNTQAELNANLATLPMVEGIGYSIKIGHVFLSLLGYARPVVERMVVQYGFSTIPGQPSKCVVYDTVFDVKGIPISGVTVTVSSSDRVTAEGLVLANGLATTDADGNFEISVIETASDGSTVDFKFDYPEGSESKSFSVKNRIVPNQATAKLSALQEG